MLLQLLDFLKTQIITDILQKSGTMSFPQTKGKLSQNVFVTIMYAVSLPFSPSLSCSRIKLHKYELCLKVALVKKIQLYFEA